MMPVLSVFIDSLMPESVENMEFLSCFENMARVKSELPSYSNTCHASIYTGVYPNKHKHFFIWKYSPETSPFNLLSSFSLKKFFNNICFNKYIKYLIFSSLCKIKRGTVHFMYTFALQPVDRWVYFDFEIVKFWEAQMNIGNYPTIFKILCENGIDCETVWKPKGSLNKIKFSPKPVTYFFIGHMDPIIHFHGPDSSEARRLLGQIDKVIEKAYINFENKYEEFLFFVFSDHGQARIEERIDPYSTFRNYGKDLNDYIHLIDSCHARFWFEKEEKRNEVEKVLDKLDGMGFILTNEIQSRYNAEMPREYGELIFCLNKPYVFLSPNKKFMHGYLPDHREMNGVLISNRSIVKRVVNLQDIAPSILQALDIRIPEYMDGEVIWK